MKTFKIAVANGADPEAVLEAVKAAIGGKPRYDEGENMIFFKAVNEAAAEDVASIPGVSGDPEEKTKEESDIVPSGDDDDIDVGRVLRKS